MLEIKFIQRNSSKISDFLYKLFKLGKKLQLLTEIEQLEILIRI